MKKRVLATLLALCMVLGFLPATALAASDDLTPPVVKGVYMNNPGGTVSVGDTIYFDVAVEDESEIVGGWLSFSPVLESEESTRHSVLAQFESYNQETRTVRMKLDIEDNIASGKWALKSARVEDYYGNVTSNYIYEPGNIDFDSCFFIVVENADDHTPPVITWVNMNNPGGTVSVGDTIYFDVAVEDESEIVGGWLSFSPVLESEESARNAVLAQFESYNQETKMVRMRLNIRDNIASGKWALRSVRIEDYYGNVTSNYISEPGNIDFDSCFFIVVENADDHTPPVVTGVYMNNPGGTVSVGDTIYFDVGVEDESEIVGGWLSFSPILDSEESARNSVLAQFESYNQETRTVRMKLDIEDNIASGKWALRSVRIEDYYGNVTSSYVSEPGNIDFDSISFTVASNDILPETVSIPGTLEVRVRDATTIRPTVTPSNSIPKWAWTSSDTGIAEVYSSGNGVSCNVSGVAPGTTTITGTTQNGLTASCEVTVLDAPLPDGGTVNESYRVGLGGYVDIVPVLTPAGATTLYEVTSDNPHVAGVGTTAGHTGVRIEGNNAGTALITIRGANGLVMTTTVKVGRDSDRQHEKITRPGREAICTRTGWTDSVICSACRYVFTEAKEIPAAGHTYEEWTVQTPATATQSGLRVRTCESCGYRERETIPATGDSAGPITPPGGPSDSSTPSASKPDRPDNETDEKRTENISAGNQSIPVTVKDGAAQIAPTEDEIAAILADAATSGVVEIDLTSVGGASELGLPRSLVNAITENGVISSLSIATGGGSIQMSGDALHTVSGALTGPNDQVAFKVDPIDAASIADTQKYPIANVLRSAVFVELSAVVTHRNEDGRVSSLEAIHEFYGDITVSIPFEPSGDVAGRQIIACYIADDGAVTYFPVVYRDGVATFTTNHFSTFAVTASRAAAFTDVDISGWYMTSAEYTLNRELMAGTTADTFSPSTTMTRAMVWTVLGRMAGADVDGSGSEWYAKAQAWAMASNISDGSNPNGGITRQELAVMLWRSAGSPEGTGDLGAFSDGGDVAEWASAAMQWAAANGILNGDNGMLKPGAPASRAEVAAMLMRFCEKTGR